MDSNQDNSKKVLLTYYSSTLRQKDINYLNDGVWLNDQVINFYMEYLTHQYVQDNDKSIILLDPAVVGSFLFIQNNKEDLEDMFKPLGLHKASRLVIIPMTDSNDLTVASSGSHWNLLV